MLAFCEKCRDMVEYTVREENMKKYIKGNEIEYLGKVAFCNECGEEIFVADIRDYNLQMLDRAYREKEGLITVSEIELILEKYNIGKRPLSSLLGWGEITITRYLNGDIPTKQYSEILKKLLNDPKYMREILEKNRKNISDAAYKRCNDALLKLEEENDISFLSEEKIDHVVKYLLVKCTDITPLALQKLLYYAQGFFKAFTGEFLFNDDCEAWIHGPVYRDVYYKYRNYGYNTIEEGNYRYDNIQLTKVEREILDSVIRNFGCYSGKVLEMMTHVEMPWSRTRAGLADDEYLDRIIEKDLIAEYFDSIKLKYNMLNISDIRDYSLDLFNKICLDM